MLSVLQDILEIFENIPAYILFALETVANLFFEAIGDLFSLVTSLIPLPSIPAVPSFISGINWFFPVGDVITIMGPIVIAYVSFLAIRWVYQKSGNL
jgi:hypothetical protein